MNTETLRFLALALVLLCPASAALAAEERPHLVVVVGAPGTEEYGKLFRTWAERWRSAAAQGDIACTLIGLDDATEKADCDVLREAITAGKNAPELWLVLLGHGTFDGKTARFNLRGPDFSAAELKAWLQDRTGPLVVVNCASCSGPFLSELAGPERVVITATRSGHEYNFARLGEYLSQAITDPKADLDKDQQTSLLEAFIVAAAGVREFYARDGRLETEHPLMDDNGDRLGTPAEWFRGLTAVRSAKEGAPLDGTLARRLILVRSAAETQFPVSLRKRRDELEQKLAALRERKAKLSEDAYLRELEEVLVPLAQLYAEADAEPPADPASNAVTESEAASQ